MYHAVTSKLISRNDARAYEWWNPAPEKDTAVDWLHPPFAKLTQATSIKIFGENSFGWRFSSVIFGTATVALIFFMSRELGFKEYTSLLATGLFALSGLALSMSRIAMNDMHVTFFVVLSIWMYWRWRKQPTLQTAIFTALATGFAVASKWSGVFLVALYIFDQALMLIRDFFQNRRIPSKTYLIFWLTLMVLLPGIYFLSYGQMFLQGKDLNHWWQLHKQTWWYQTNLDATHPYQSTPWQWILNMRPVYAFTNSTSLTLKDIYIQENVALAWAGFLAAIWSFLDVTVFGFTTVKYIWQSAFTQQKKWLTKLKKHWLNKTETYRILFVLAAYGVFWLPWVFSPRIMFFYHYLPSIPFLCILLAYQLEFVREKLKYGNHIVFGVIGIMLLTFVLFYPHWTALPVSREGWSNIYFWMENWR